jgi:hypothetical protein
MDEIEAFYKMYFRGDLSIVQLCVKVAATSPALSDPSDRLRYKAIVLQFWYDFIQRQIQMKTSVSPADKMSLDNFLLIVLHYARIKSEYGE